MAIVISSTAPRGYVLSITVTDGHDRSTLNQDVSELLNSSRCSEFQEGDEIEPCSVAWVSDCSWPT